MNRMSESMASHSVRRERLSSMKMRALFMIQIIRELKIVSFCLAGAVGYGFFLFVTAIVKMRSKFGSFLPAKQL